MGNFGDITTVAPDAAVSGVDSSARGSVLGPVIYLDFNATTPLRREALAALRTAAFAGGNPASLHAAGQAARRTHEAAATTLRQRLGAPDAKVIFTGSGTEANALALSGLARHRRAHGGGTRLLLSTIEHPCMSAAAQKLAGDGFVVEVVPVGRDGVLDLGELQRRLGPDVAVVAVMLANNETGVLQPLAEVARLARQHGVPVHTDAVQAAGKIVIDVQALGVATLALAGHKFGGPKGIGALVVRPGEELVPLWHGGGQESGLRPGTPAVPLVSALAAALSAADSAEERERVAGLRQELEDGLRRLRGAFVVAEGAPRLPNTLSLGFRGVGGRGLAEALSARGVMVSPGAACHGDRPTPSAVLRAMGLDDASALSVLRFSLGYSSTRAEVGVAVAAAREALEVAA